MAAEDNDPEDLRDVKAILRGLQRIGDQRPQAGAASKMPGGAASALENLTRGASRSPGRPGERAPPQARIGSGDAESSADKPPVHGKRLAALALAMLAAGTVMVLAGDLFLKYWPGSPSGRPDAAASGGGTSAAVGDTSAAVTKERAGARTSTPAWPVETSEPVPPADAVDDRTASPAVAAAPPNPDITSVQQLMSGGHIVAARERLRQPDLAASQEGAWLLARSYDPNYLRTIQSPDASADKRQAEEWYRRWRDISVRNGMVMDDLRLKRIINSMQ